MEKIEISDIITWTIVLILMIIGVIVLIKGA